MKLVVVICTCLLSLTMAEPNSESNPTEIEFKNRNSTVVRLAVTFEAFAPQGLRISIPKIEGIDLLAFHGKINLPIRKREQGNLTWEVTLPKEDKLVKVFPNSQLLIGDIINYWIRVQYNGVSLPSDSLSYIVKELTPAPFPMELQQSSDSYENIELSQTTHASNRRTNLKKSRTTTTPAPYYSVRPEAPHAPTDSNDSCGCNEEALKDVWAQMNATAGKMRMLEESYAPLEDKLKSLTETVDELIKNMNIGTNLLLTGNLPVRTNPVEDVRHLIIEKLRLPDLSMSILQAEYKTNGILFEVASSIDKLRILKRSKDILSKLSYQIIDPDRPPFDVRNAK